jgi:hypothetical protein
MIRSTIKSRKKKRGKCENKRLKGKSCRRQNREKQGGRGGGREMQGSGQRPE